nr:TraF protein [uncultured bacterium]
MKLTAWIAIAGTGLLASVAIAGFAGARINTTKSIPLGLYWESSAPVAKGEYVIFCPPQINVFSEAKERGYISGGFCPGGYGNMMKKILAAKDDAVAVTDEGIAVNGLLLPLSQLKTADPSGRPLPRYQSNQYTLGAAEVLLMSDVSATSFDARYFGPISTKQIKSVIRPVFTWS